MLELSAQMPSPGETLQAASERSPVALIVDDNPVVSATLAHTLEREGIVALKAADLREARAILQRRPVDIVFVDPGLPDGSGFDLITESNGAGSPHLGSGNWIGNAHVNGHLNGHAHGNGSGHANGSGHVNGNGLGNGNGNVNGTAHLNGVSHGSGNGRPTKIENGKWSANAIANRNEYRMADDKWNADGTGSATGNGHWTTSCPHRPDFVVMTADASLDTAVTALRHGALDFLVKPIERKRLRVIVEHVSRSRAVRRPIDHLREDLWTHHRFGSLVGRSPAMKRVYDLIARVAPTRATVLILGESGTGKELVAQTLHDLSPRCRESFLAVNCGAIASTMIESELFGHEKGSFTGAGRSRKGYFEEANGGTILLDEITEMPFELQVRLLRVLETGSVVRVGSSHPVPVDVRVIAASHRDPQQAVREGKLREDLFYRLNVFPIALPALRDRGGDIELLASYFLEAYNDREQTTKSWAPAALGGLSGYRWPGNVRELKNFVERAAILSGGQVSDPGMPELMTSGQAYDGSSIRVPLNATLAQVERLIILATLEETNGDKNEAALRLGVSLKTIYNRVNGYNAVVNEGDGAQVSH